VVVRAQVKTGIRKLCPGDGIQAESCQIKRTASWDEFRRAGSAGRMKEKVNLVGQPSSASDRDSQSFESVASEKGLVHFCRFLLGSMPPALCCARTAPALTLETFACCPEACSSATYHWF
jgi:hypothetical protein